MVLEGHNGCKVSLTRSRRTTGNQTSNGELEVCMLMHLIGVGFMFEGSIWNSPYCRSLGAICWSFLGHEGVPTRSRSHYGVM